MKIAILNDTHCGVRNSSDIWIEYQRKFYEEEFFPYLLENGITKIIHLGDYYEHRKFINFKALNANRRHFLDHLREYGIHMDIIPGNHDVFYKNTNKLCALNELLGYYLDEVNIVDEPTVMDYDGCNIALIPWINPENYANTMKFIDECNSSIVGAHLELDGFEMMKGVMNTHGMSPSIFSKFEQVWSGHFHTKSTRGNISYLGSQMEFTWADCNDPKHFHIFDTSNRELISVQNTVTIYEKIIYDDTKYDYFEVYPDQYKEKFVKIIVNKKTDGYMFDKFVDKVQASGAYEVKIAETFEEFAGERVDTDSVSVEDTTTLLDNYVDNVETDLDKDKIKSMMRNFYVEASNLEIV